MLTKRTNLIVAVCMGILLCIFGCIGMAEIANRNSEGQAPIRGLRITIDEGQREKLFTQLSEFADKHTFEIQIDEVNTASGKHFNVWMSRDDIFMIARNVPKAPTKVRISFYDKDPAHPAHKETVDNLFNDLKSFISEIPNVTISEEK